MNAARLKAMTLAIAMAGLVVACDADPVVSPTPSAPSGATPAPSASPSADALPAWAEAGPGWFLVTYNTEPDTEVAGSDIGFGPGTRTSGAITLIAPDGTPHDAGSLAELDVSGVMAWLGKDVLLFTVNHAESSYPQGTVKSLDLSTGEPTTVISDIYVGEMMGATPSGDLITGAFGGDGSNIQVVGEGWSEHELCTDLSTPRYQTIAPGGDYLACVNYQPGGDGTEVTVVDTSAPYAARVVASFARRAHEYSVAGWWSATELLLARDGGDGNLVYFALDVEEEAIREFDVPFAPSPVIVSFDHGSRTYLRLRTDGVMFYNELGEDLAFASCGVDGDPHGVPVTISGNRAAVTCTRYEGDTVTASMWLIDLETGQSFTVHEGLVGEGFSPVGAILPYWGENA